MTVRISLYGIDLPPAPAVTRVPLELLSRVLGLQYRWHEASRTLYIESPLEGRTIILDPAPAGLEGCSDRHEACTGGEPTLAIAGALRDRLQAAGAHVVQTRASGQWIPPEERQRLVPAARAEAALHLRPGASTGARTGRGRHGVGARHALWPCRSRRLATDLLAGLAAATALPSRGVGVHWSLGRRTPTAVLECGCPGDQDARCPLRAETFRAACVEGLYQGLLRYFARLPRQLAEARAAALAALREVDRAGAAPDAADLVSPAVDDTADVAAEAADAAAMGGAVAAGPVAEPVARPEAAAPVDRSAQAGEPVPAMFPALLPAPAGASRPPEPLLDRLVEKARQVLGTDEPPQFRELNGEWVSHRAFALLQEQHRADTEVKQPQPAAGETEEPPVAPSPEAEAAPTPGPTACPPTPAPESGLARACTVRLPRTVPVMKRVSVPREPTGR